jgi:hypothetical protein
MAPSDSENPFRSPNAFDPAREPQPVLPVNPSGSRLGEIISRAFNSYMRQWSEWPVPMLLLALIMLVCYVACVFPFLIAQGPLMCAAFGCAFRNLRGWPVDTSALRRGMEVFWPAVRSGICLLVLQAIPIVIIAAFFGAAMAIFAATMGPKQPGGQPDPAVVLPAMFGMMAVYMVLIFGFMIWTIYFATRTMFVMPLVADRGYGFFSAWHASWDATRKRFWERLLLVVLAGILGGLGVYLCYVGVIFTMPLYFLILAAAYEDEFGIGDLTTGGTPAPLA